MRVLARALTGIALTCITVGLIGASAWRLHDAVTSADKRKRPPARERSYAIDAGQLTATRVAPIVTAYGQVQAWKTLEIRAPAAGPVTEISENFRDGLVVEKGELLFRIDPEIAERRVIDAKAALAQAETERAEAQQSRRHMQAEVASAKAQLAVRNGDLERKTTLFQKKLLPAASLDEARLSVSAAEQGVVAKEQAMLALEGRIEKAEAGVERARLSLSDAQRALNDTSYRAPFTGRLTDVALTLGRRLSQNEKLAELIDPQALEVSFPVRNADIARLLDPARPQRLLPLPVTATLDLVTEDIVVEGTLERTAAVAPVQTGRTVFARLGGGNAAALSPGDFVTVRITEPAIDNVAVIPAEAASVDGRILVVGEDGRLEDVKTRIVRRQADTLIVADAPFGKAYALRRLPYLAPGIKVDTRDKSRETPPVASANDGNAGAAAASSGTAGERRGRRDRGGAREDGEVVAIDEARRAALIAHVKANVRMSEDRKQRILDELAKPQPSRRVVERIEQQIVRAGGARS